MAVKKRILVVDDDADIVLMIRRILEKAGFEVGSATDGAEALRKIEQEKFDLILLDVMMPGIDGFEVARNIQRNEKGERPPVVFVTARDDSESMREGFRSGGTVFLSKPFTASQLMRIVNAMISR
jgi:two-component system OmpR family response regulator